MLKFLGKLLLLKQLYDAYKAHKSSGRIGNKPRGY